MNEKEIIKQIQNADVLSIAEKITGKSYKTDNDTEAIGFGLHIKKNKILSEILEKNNDTKFSETIENYLKKVLDFGFEIILEEDFEADGRNEKFYILWHNEFSLLLSFDSFWGNRNSARLYYNWSPNERIGRGSYTSSGHYVGFHFTEDFSKEMPYQIEIPKWEKGEEWETFSKRQQEWKDKANEYIKENKLRAVWCGDHDGREAIKNNISLLAENGVFLKKWIEIPFLWLLHHGNTKGHYDYEEINKNRISKFPQHIKEKMGFVE